MITSITRLFRQKTPRNVPRGKAGDWVFFRVSHLFAQYASFSAFKTLDFSIKDPYLTLTASQSEAKLTFCREFVPEFFKNESFVLLVNKSHQFSFTCVKAHVSLFLRTVVSFARFYEKRWCTLIPRPLSSPVIPLSNTQRKVLPASFQRGRLREWFVLPLVKLFQKCDFNAEKISLGISLSQMDQLKFSTWCWYYYVLTSDCSYLFNQIRNLLHNHVL